MNHLDQWQSPDVHAVRAGVAAPAPASCSCKRKAYAVAGVEAQGSAGKPRNVKGKIEGKKKKNLNTTSFLQLGLMIGIADSKFHLEGAISVREVMPFIKLI